MAEQNYPPAGPVTLGRQSSRPRSASPRTGAWLADALDQPPTIVYEYPTEVTSLAAGTP
jgi:hypothetical protein